MAGMLVEFSPVRNECTHVLSSGLAKFSPRDLTFAVNAPVR